MEEYSVEECIKELRNLYPCQSQGVKEISSVDDCLSELQTSQLLSVIPIIKRLRELMLSSSSRSDLNNSHWKDLTELAEGGSCILLSKSDHSVDELEWIRLYLGFLRNSCAGWMENQDHVLNTPAVFNFVKKSLDRFMDTKTQKGTVILKVCMQVFGNILVCNPDSKQKVWKIFFEENKFQQLFKCVDEIKDITMLVLCCCLCDENCKSLFNTKEGHLILIYVTDCFLKGQVMWTGDVVDVLLDRKALFDNYLEWPPNNRRVFIEVMEAHFKYDLHRKTYIGFMKNIKNLFLKFLTNIQASQLEPYEVETIMSILCAASVKERHMPMLQSSQNLLQGCVGTLKIIHGLEKQGNNVFGTDEDSYFCNFKTNLIRLIGNLSYRCKENQDLVRNMDGIPLILDCCKYDASKPVMKEWCILAIRNLLENNLDNQAVVAGISTHGEVVESEFLNSMGLMAVKEGDTIRVRSKPK